MYCSNNIGMRDDNDDNDDNDDVACCFSSSFVLKPEWCLFTTFGMVYSNSIREKTMFDSTGS